MSDKQAQAKAWVRKKPKRTTHNQLFIQFLMIVALESPFALGPLIIVFAFCMPFMPLAILIVDVIASIAYIALDIKYNRFKPNE